jgi:Uma2 family endonuclease
VTKTEAERVTYAQLQELPWSRHRHYELFDGELITHDSRIERRPVAGLWAFLVEMSLHRRLPPPATKAHWYVDENNVYMPDAMYPLYEVTKDDAGRIRSRKAYPPALAIDMLEPPSHEPDLRRLTAYARAGLPWYWVVDSEVPSYTIYELVGETLVQQASVEGDDVLEVQEPFHVKLCPNDQVV